MQAADPRLQLSAEERQTLDCLLSGFEGSWDETQFTARLATLPQPGHPLRYAALAGLVRIDLTRRWLIGSPRWPFTAAWPWSRR